MQSLNSGFWLLAQADASQGSSLAFLLPVLIFLIFYFVLIRPMRTRQKKLEAMIVSLKNGDKVITNGGIYGTIAGIRENTFLLKVSDRAKIEIAKNAISSLQSGPKENA